MEINHGSYSQCQVSQPTAINKQKITTINVGQKQKLRKVLEHFTDSQIRETAFMDLVSSRFFTNRFFLLYLHSPCNSSPHVDSPETANREIAFFFPEFNVFDFETSNKSNTRYLFTSAAVLKWLSLPAFALIVIFPSIWVVGQTQGGVVHLKESVSETWKWKNVIYTSW